ncbi:hypothetical protein [Nocardia sp. NPDC005998]|uniref:hypothetical protein n=1 Tax=Nocardia sp. NPDC005998 TaxID=3156894 RepID=UPI0033BEC1E9
MIGSSTQASAFGGGGQRDAEQEHALIRSVYEQPRGHHRNLRTADGTGIRHELLRADARGVQQESRAGAVVHRDRLQRRHVVAVRQLGDHERSDGALGRGHTVVGEAPEKQVVVNSGDDGQCAGDRHKPFVQVRILRGVVRERREICGGAEITQIANMPGQPPRPDLFHAIYTHSPAPPIAATGRVPIRDRHQRERQSEFRKLAGRCQSIGSAPVVSSLVVP